MKWQVIKRCCLARGAVMIYNDPVQGQWIGTSEAVWRVEGVTIHRESIPAIFDVSPAKADGCYTEETLMDIALQPDERYGAERNVDEHMCVRYRQQTYALLSCADELYLVEIDKIKAAGLDKGYERYKMARNAYDAPLLLLYQGMILAGIIRPMPASALEGFCGDLTRMAGMVDGRRQSDEQTRERTQAERLDMLQDTRLRGQEETRDDEDMDTE